ncbi:unnamed protein product [Amoebophrya sp. A120]|nr:unnamed protein product [Amoebophrya sp. A120]|eukprot:GSA120T00017796001.1
MESSWLSCCAPSSGPRGLTLQSTARSQQHPAKAQMHVQGNKQDRKAARNADAYLLMDNAIGIADGVSAVEESGVDSSLLPNELLTHCGALLRERRANKRGWSAEYKRLLLEIEKSVPVEQPTGSTASTAAGWMQKAFDVLFGVPATTPSSRDVDALQADLFHCALRESAPARGSLAASLSRFFQEAYHVSVDKPVHHPTDEMVQSWYDDIRLVAPEHFPETEPPVLLRILLEHCLKLMEQFRLLHQGEQLVADPGKNELAEEDEAAGGPSARHKHAAPTSGASGGAAEIVDPLSVLNTTGGSVATFFDNIGTTPGAVGAAAATSVDKGSDQNNESASTTSSSGRPSKDAPSSHNGGTNQLAERETSSSSLEENGRTDIKIAGQDLEAQERRDPTPARPTTQQLPEVQNATQMFLDFLPFVQLQHDSASSSASSSPRNVESHMLNHVQEEFHRKLGSMIEHAALGNYGDARRVLQEAFWRCTQQGSTTAMLFLIEKDILHPCNMGDCAYVVLRPNCDPEIAETICTITVPPKPPKSALQQRRVRSGLPPESEEVKAMKRASLAAQKVAAVVSKGSREGESVLLEAEMIRNDIDGDTSSDINTLPPGTNIQISPRTIKSAADLQEEADELLRAEKFPENKIQKDKDGEEINHVQLHKDQQDRNNKINPSSSSSRPPRYTVVSRSISQTHCFNCPYQLSRMPTYQNKPYQDAPSLWRQIRNIRNLHPVLLQPGDVIISGTDGLFDNVFESRMAALAGEILLDGNSRLGRCSPVSPGTAERFSSTSELVFSTTAPSGEDSTTHPGSSSASTISQAKREELCDRLLQEALKNANPDSTAATPWAEEWFEECGYPFPGLERGGTGQGKPDDTTVVVSVVTSKTPEVGELFFDEFR